MKNKLKQRREELGLTQRKVAELVGIAYQQYQKYESGNYMPSVLLGIKIANALESDIPALWGSVLVVDYK